jgi:Ca2+-binding RTX toxin-like protein
MSEDRFGGDVAIHGDTIVVGAYFRAETTIASGAVYVFDIHGVGDIQERTKLVPSDSSGGDLFGAAVAIWDEVVVVGASGNDDAGEDAGLAYVFTPDGGGGYSERKLTASDASPNGRFGRAVGIHGDAIAISANGAQHEVGGPELGAVYVYPLGAKGSTIEHKLIASDTTLGDGFGTTMELWGDTVIVGSTGDDDGGLNAGAVYVFRGGVSGYAQVEKLTASDSGNWESFGRSLDIAGENIAVAADGRPDFVGAVYIYSAAGTSGFTEVKLTASRPQAAGFFTRPALHGDTLAVGSPGYAGGSRNEGAVYVYGVAASGATCDGVAATVDLRRGEVPTDGDDVIVGTVRDDIIYALDGDDVVCALGGSDEVSGGPGDDTIFGGPKADVLSGNAGNDTLFGEGGNDVIFAGSGLDTVEGGLGKDLIGGGGDIDFVSGGPADDVISGGSGNDLVVNGDDGNDVVVGGGGNDIVDGNDGDDVVSGNGGKDVVRGGAGDDELRGGPNDDDLFGGPGDDFLAGNDGNDGCDGGTLDELLGDTAAASCERAVNVP